MATFTKQVDRKRPIMERLAVGMLPLDWYRCFTVWDFVPSDSLFIVAQCGCMPCLFA